MTNPDRQRNFQIRDTVSEIFNATKKEKNQGNRAAFSDLARSRIDERFEKGSDDHSLAMFFFDQIDERNKPPGGPE